MNIESNPVLMIIDAYSSDRPDFTLPRDPNPALVQHLYDVGLSSITLHAAGLNIDAVRSSPYSILADADLTARFVHSEMRSTTRKVLKVANINDIPVVLLKGICLADKLYRAPHHRVMGDVDILVPLDAANDFFTALQSAGFRVKNSNPQVFLPRDHHHLPEIRDRDNEIVVEVHTGLFSQNRLSNCKLFHPSAFWDLTQPSTFDGITCRSFQPELELLYAAAHWATDQKWSLNVMSINDILLISRSKEVHLDWERVISLSDDCPLLIEYLTILFLFFRKRSMLDIPRSLHERIERSAVAIGRRNVAFLHSLMSRFPLFGRNTTLSPAMYIIVNQIWHSMLEQRNPLKRPFFACFDLLFRRSGSKSRLGSVFGRLKTLARLMRKQQ